ncbi:MAG: GvpL/GvpF family gas vesicle protein [Synechococcales bacterium]|nr:GvpL/GvpF family gas vesicle protein [Synechococcales bacterium]
MYTYAFLADSEQPLTLPQGIQGSTRLVSTSGIAALIEPAIALDDLQQNDDQLVQAVIAHDRVNRGLFQQTDILPLRFGTCFPSTDHLMRHLDTHAADYLRQLAALQGKAEYLLKLLPVPLPELTASATDRPLAKGRNYFLAKKQQYQTQAEQRQQQQDELAQVIQQINAQYPNAVRGATEDDAERVYVLGDRHQEDLLLNRCQSWQTACPLWHLTITEALPPYHFVGG